MNTHADAVVRLTHKAQQEAARRLQTQKLRQLVELIDDLSGEMGSSDFREAVRLFGYDIDACAATLGRRGVSIN